MLARGEGSVQAITGSVKDALRLGCVAIGYTIYPARPHRLEMYTKLREMSDEAKENGLAVVVWSYPRGSGLSKEGETGIDVTAYAAHIAAQLGAHVVKVKPPAAHLEQAAAKKVYEKDSVPIGTLAERVRHVVQSRLQRARASSSSPAAGRRSATSRCSTRSAPFVTAAAFGSIIGRNSFQRKKPDA